MARPRKRWALWALLLLAVPWALYEMVERAANAHRLGELDELALPALSLTLVVLTTGLAGVLIRNLVVLIVERKRGLLGSHLRMKLVFYYLALVLLPAFVLFYGSVHVIKKTIDATLTAPLEYMAQGERLVSAWTDFFERSSRRQAAEAADRLAGVDADIATLASLRSELDPERVALVRLYRGAGAALESPAEGPSLATLAERLDQLAEESLTAGRPRSGIDYLDDGLVAIASAPVGEAAAVTVVSHLPSSIARDLRWIHDSSAEFQQFKVDRRDLQRFYLTLIGLVFIATTFVATWIGLFVARRITEPIHEVAAAAREISIGNLDVRVRSEVGDELGLLVESFNEMASELEESRAVITRSTADLRRSNRALDERRRYIETLVEHLSTAVVSVDNEGRVTIVNPAVRTILGLDLENGADLRAAFSRPGYEPLRALLEAEDLSGDGARHDLELSDPAPRRNVSVQMTRLVGRRDEPVGTLVMVENVTELLRAQRVLAWHEVARRIAHEIKNPLTPIRLFAQRMRKKYREGAEDLGEVVAESTEAIEREVTGLMQLVDEFSQYARMPTVDPRPADLSEVIESVLALYRGAGEVEWEVEVDPALGRVRIDAGQMRRVLINLVDNALSATSGRGPVRIAAGPGDAPGRVRLEVADGGPGIPARDREKMFVPYFSTKSKGTGLGLAIVHKVISEHHGTIRVEDNHPRGARFVMDIPA